GDAVQEADDDVTRAVEKNHSAEVIQVDPLFIVAGSQCEGHRVELHRLFPAIFAGNAEFDGQAVQVELATEGKCFEGKEFHSAYFSLVAVRLCFSSSSSLMPISCSPASSESHSFC